MSSFGETNVNDYNLYRMDYAHDTQKNQYYQNKKELFVEFYLLNFEYQVSLDKVSLQRFAKHVL